MEKKFNRANLLIIEYVSGVDLLHLSPKRAIGIFKTKEGKENLKNIGKLIVLDFLVNNLDRIPVVWFNVGNFRNVMFQDNSTVVGIDNVKFF